MDLVPRLLNFYGDLERRLTTSGESVNAQCAHSARDSACRALLMLRRDGRLRYRRGAAGLCAQERASLARYQGRKPKRAPSTGAP